MQMSDNLRGALIMSAAMAAFTINDTLMKSIAGQVPLFQQAYLRGILTTLLIALWVWRSKAITWRISRKDRGVLLLRSVSEIGAAYFFLTALFNMPLANVTAILQSLPLTVTLAAAVFFGEPLGWRRMSAILIGLVGVLLIVRPGTDAFTVDSLYALIAVALITVRDLATRKLSGNTHAMLVALATSLGVTLFFGLGSIGAQWVPVSISVALVLSAAAAIVLVAYLLSVMMMRVGEVGFVSPFRYTGLIWSLLLGWLVFDDWPKLITFVGAGIVVCSGVFMLYRESQIAKAAR